MRERNGASRQRRRESGATLYLVAVATMFVLLGIAGLAIDLVSYYTVRGEAQRAADAAALAGASVFLSQGCTTGSGGCTAGGAQEAPATTQATSVAAQNSVGGQAPSSSSVDVTFSYPNNEEPQINVRVCRDAAHGNQMATVFAKILGVTGVDVSATATAEAYNPSGGGTSVGISCLRPFLVPNCDSTHPVLASNAEANKNCGGTGKNDGATIACTGGGTCYPSYFFDPNNKGVAVNPGTYNSANPSSGGVVGEPWGLHSDAAPSQWYLLGYTGNSGAALRTFIETCAPPVIACNSSLNTANGKKVGPADQGIDTLINSSGNGPGNGQDSICSPTYAANGSFCTTPPFPITGGSGNPDPSLQGKTFYSGSSSIISVAVYDGTALAPGGSTVTVLGFMQLFVVDANHVGNADLIDTVVLNIGGCGTSGTTSPPVVSTGGSLIPIRLIHQ